VSPSAARRQESHILEEIVRATQTLAQKRIGALIVLERDTQLDDQVEGGVTLDAGVSRELLVSLFLPYSPLHDGAVLIQNGRISRASVILPLSNRQDLPQDLGTRHRAALGLAAETDAVVLVVSEETAGISIVHAGEIRRAVDPARLRTSLREVLATSREESAAAEAEEKPTEDAAPAEEAGEAAGARAANARSTG
jgi:diadenylate cyclase